jgi:outer membrane murein-binding lipoprotein Lpp
MPANTSRSAARLAAAVLLVVLVSGCAGNADESSTAAQATTTASTVAPTTTTIPPMTAEELAWLKGVSALRTKVEKSFQTGGSVQVTRAYMMESSRKLAAWSRQLRRLGTPSDRLQPAHTLVRRAIRTYDKGAKCYATAASVSMADGGVIAGTPEARTQSKALECGGAAEGNGTNLLYKADAKGDDLKAKYS